MKFNIVTIFPDMVKSYLGASILKRAIDNELLTVNVHNLREYATGRHKVVDDYPYGGGPGMVMKPEPFFRIVETCWPARENRRVILLSPKGRIFDQETASALSEEKSDIVFLCGRYEAIDERVSTHLIDEEISIGDYILTGGELAALVIIDAVARLVPGVLGDYRSSEEDSFSCGLLDYPHYTRPASFRGMKVPDVLISGHHGEIARWRREQSLKTTLEKRPELLKKVNLSPSDEKLLKQIKEEKDEPYTSS